MTFNLNEFRQNMKAGGARPTLFRVIINFPEGVQNGQSATRKLAFTMKSQFLPTSQVGMIEVPYFGRVAKFKGDRMFEDWTGTIINDEDFLVRNALEDWQNGFNKISGDTNSLQDPGTTEQNFLADVTVEQYGKSGQVIKTYVLKNAWPINISQIQLGWENRDQIEEYDVTFAYDYHETERIRG